MEGFDVSLVGWNGYLGTSAGRDKIGKFVHYFFRAVAGLSADRVAAADKGSAARAFWENVHAKSRALFVRVMDSRRTVRWFSSLGIIIALRKGPESYPWKNKGMFFVAQITLLFWHWVDHLRWLQSIGWVSGDQMRSKRISFTGFVVSSLVSSIYWAKELKEHEESVENKDKAKGLELRLNLAKNLLTLVSTLHVSEIFLTHEFVCGMSGALASVIDIYQTFPRVKKA